MMLVSIFFRRPIIRLIYGNIADDVMGAASIYFLITACSYPFLAIYNAAGSLFRSVGNSKMTMRIALLVNILNVAGNYILIYVAKLGIAGAAISTLISRAVAAAIVLTLLITNKRIAVSLSGITKINFRAAMIHNILNVAIPSAVENSMFQIGRLLTQRIFTSFGTAAIAGNAIASVINSFSFMPGQAYCLSLVTIVGQCIGAGDIASAKLNTKKVMKLSYATLFIMNVFIYVFMENLISLFSLSSEAHSYAVLFLSFHCISMTIGWAPSFALPNALRAAGDAKYVMFVAAISMWTVRVSAAYLMAFFFHIGPLGVWLGMGLDFIARGASYIIRWHGGKWMNKKVIE
jgi:putative MATE family efflux protein